MTEENCSYIKNVRNTHFLDEHNNLPGCEIELSKIFGDFFDWKQSRSSEAKLFAAANYLAFWLGIQTATFP